MLVNVLVIINNFGLDYHTITRSSTRTALQWRADWVSNRSGVTPEEFISDVVIPVEEMVRAVEVYTEADIDGENIFKLLPNETFCGESPYRVSGGKQQFVCLQYDCSAQSGCSTQFTIALMQQCKFR